MNTEDTILNKGVKEETVINKAVSDETVVSKGSGKPASETEKKPRLNKVAAAAAAVGGGIGSVFASTITDDNDEPEVDDNEIEAMPDTASEEIVAEADQADPVVNDEMSFGEAFAAARAAYGPGAVFEWNGNKYNTYYKEELDEQKAEPGGDPNDVTPKADVSVEIEDDADDVQVIGVDTDEAIVIDDNESAFVADVDEVYVEGFDDPFADTSFDSDSYMPEDSMF